MIQLSWDKDAEMHRLAIDLRANELTGKDTVEVRAFNKAGGVLASIGLVVQSPEEGDLLPNLLAQCCVGWLFGGSKEAVSDPWADFKQRRHELKLKAKAQGRG